MGGASKAQQRSESFQESASSGAAASQSFVDPRQVPFLDLVRQMGLDVAGAQVSSIPSVTSELTGRLGGAGGRVLNNLEAASTTPTPGATTAVSGLLGLANAPTLPAPAATPGFRRPTFEGLDFQSLLEPGEQLGAEIDALDAAIQRNLEGTLGTIAGQFTLGGQTGGDRQAFFSNEAARDARETFSREAAGLISRDLAARRNLAGTAANLQLGLGGLELGAAEAEAANAIARSGLDLEGSRLSLADFVNRASALEGAGGLALGDRGIQLDASSEALNALPTLFNLGISPFGAQLSPLLALAEIVGAPTVLSRSASRQQSRSRGEARGRADSFGFDLLPGD